MHDCELCVLDKNTNLIISGLINFSPFNELDRLNYREYIKSEDFERNFLEV